MTTAAEPLSPSRKPPFGRRVATFFHRHPRLQVTALLALPAIWLIGAYIGSLVVLLVAAFWTLDTFTAEVVHTFTIDNFKLLVETEVYRAITIRTLGMGAAVTVADFVLALPIAYYMAKVATPRTRNLLVVAVLMPLWTSYLVKVYAWRVVLQEEGILNWALGPFGLHGPGFGWFGAWLVFTYLWLPYMILPLYAGLERIPDSLLEASSDLGARAGRTFRRVVMPLVLPAAVAGSIFTFSLTIGDFITPQIVYQGKQFIGNVVYVNVGVANNLPLAAAFATVPVVVMVIYLLIARRLGAFENL
jgi:putative spermidine/putrescine transport system permease protein